MTFAAVNYLVTLALAMTVLSAYFCRITQIDMRKAVWRYVAPIPLGFFWSVGVFLSLVGGDKPDWYQPLGLLALAMYLWNTRFDWEFGMPLHYLRVARLSQAPNAERSRKRTKWENAAVATISAFSIGVAGVGASEGRGDPLQIYSAHAEPSAIYPGQNIEIVYNFRRVRACPGYVSRFILNAESGATVQTFDQTPTGGAPIGKRMVGVPVKIELDDDLAPGRYIYRAVIYSDCEDAKYIKQTPDVPFVISPRPATEATQK